MDSGRLLLTAHRVARVTMNLYPIDIELMFSRRSFLGEGSPDFAIVRPALSREVRVAREGEPQELALPQEYASRPLIVEVVGEGQRASVPWFSNRLRVRVMEAYGQLEVRQHTDGRPAPQTYVKVFARAVDGRIRFWKDGYTDLRGRFDYVSRNDRKPEEAAEFAILVLHPELGAVVRTARPPLR